MSQRARSARLARCMHHPREGRPSRRILAFALFLTSAAHLFAQTNAGTESTPIATQPTARPSATENGGNDKETAAPSDNNSSSVDAGAFQVLTGVGATVAGRESTSYKVNETNDAFSATNVGRKTPEILLGGGFILPWQKGGGWIERSYCGPNGAKIPPGEIPSDCKPGGAYKNYRPYEVFLSIRFSPATDQTLNGFVAGVGYRITKYLSLLIGYSVTPVAEPSPGFRVAAAQIVSANPTITPYNRYNAPDLLGNKPGAFDGFPLFVYDANGVTTTKLFLSSPTVTHHASGVYFGVGVPLNLGALFKPKKD